jgi:dolichyl-phosphate beta-glucosyltransferase
MDRSVSQLTQRWRSLRLEQDLLKPDVIEPDVLDSWQPEAIAPGLPMLRLSVILPVYNEQNCLDHTVDVVLAYAQAHPDIEFIFVDDGSTDRTHRQLARRLAHQANDATQIRYTSYAQRQGKGYAVKQGVKLAIGEYICFLDGDLAYSLEHLEPILRQLEHCDLVIGCRNLVDQQLQGVKPSRHLAGKIFNSLSQLILQLHFSDMQAGLKGFRRPVAVRLFSQIQTTGFAFDVELMYLAQKQGYTIGEIPAYLAPHHVDKPSKVKLFQDSVQMLFELFRIRYNDWTGRYD